MMFWEFTKSDLRLLTNRNYVGAMKKVLFLWFEIPEGVAEELDFIVGQLVLDITEGEKIEISDKGFENFSRIFFIVFEWIDSRVVAHESESFVQRPFWTINLLQFIRYNFFQLVRSCIPSIAGRKSADRLH